MTKLVLIAFAPGIASLDVTTGARTRTLVLFGIVAFGVALSLFVGPRMAGMRWLEFFAKTRRSSVSRF